MDRQLLHQYKAAGWLKFQCHPTLPLRIWNYTDAAQFSRKWDKVTSQCRALVLEDDGRVIARSFSKFHNIEEGLHTATNDFVVYEKLDGSLIVLFFYHNQWQVASRGSFTSQQASMAREMLDRMYDTSHLDTGLSYVFEIIYEENRIIIDYGKRHELVFLAAFDPSGVEHWPEQQVIAAGFRLVRRFDNLGDYQQIKQLDWDNAEGFVVRFSNGDRVKIKFSTYCMLHKAMSNMDEVTVWEWFKAGQQLPDVINSTNVPDELHAWVAEVYSSIQAMYDKHRAEATDLASSHASLTRKQCAEALKGNSLQSLVFAIMDDKRETLHSKLCKMVKPQTARKVGYPGAWRGSPKPRQPTLTLLVGIAASGKTTKARQMARDNPDAVMVSRDALRVSLFNYTEYYNNPLLHKCEESVTSMEMGMIRAALQQGNDVIVDDTNLRMRTINNFLKAFNDTDIHFELLDISTDEALLRDSKRPCPVGRQVILRHAALLHQLHKQFDFEPRHAPTPLATNPTLPTAYVFDLDGTLAINSGRQPFDWTRVSEDKLDSAVATTLASVRKAGHAIIICTARDAVAEEATKKWLDDNHVYHDGFKMRAAGDGRPDFEVKEDFWRAILLEYNIVALVDDREQVVRRARKLGLKVLQADYGFF